MYSFVTLNNFPNLTARLLYQQHQWRTQEFCPMGGVFNKFS